jgi:thiamine transport system ATP-binding protein
LLRIDNIAIGMGAGNDRLTADLSLTPGKRIAVLGPSGAGKSTLLDLIAGFRIPEQGRLLWGERDLTQLPPEKRPVSILFQDANLFPHLDLTRNLGLALHPDGRKPGPEDRQRIDGALERVGLGGMAARRPGTLSGGQQSRAALARVLLRARPILLLDEPFAALGPALKRDMLTVVGEVADSLGALTLMVTHDPEDAKRFAQEVVLVAEGLVYPPIRTEAFFAVPPKPFRDYLGD